MLTDVEHTRVVVGGSPGVAEPAGRGAQITTGEVGEAAVQEIAGTLPLAHLVLICLEGPELADRIGVPPLVEGMQGPPHSAATAAPEQDQAEQHGRGGPLHAGLLGGRCGGVARFLWQRFRAAGHREMRWSNQ